MTAILIRLFRSRTLAFSGASIHDKTIKKPAVTLAFRCYWILLENELVEVRGIEPLSVNIQYNSPTCVADDLKFAVAHAHRPA